MQYIFWIALFIIFWANVGYPFCILIIGKLSKKQNKKKYKYFPNVTIMVVAHNEENVILNKLHNLEKIEYPSNKLSVLIASDNSSDATNSIVETYIYENPNRDVKLYKAQKRMGKTNAQNEAQKEVTTEYLVMTDANSMLDTNSIKELMSSFVDETISYVTGKLVYVNDKNSDTSKSESIYWNLDLAVREVESRLQTITAGNGALYAIRNSDYHDFKPIESHDSSMPIYFALNNKRAIANHHATAYEKAGENTEDEFNRKVRMNRVLLSHIIPSAKILNVFKYKWFTFFYLGHRTSRYLLWLAHLLLLLSNILLSFNSAFFFIVLIIHLSVLVLVVIYHNTKVNSKVARLIYYYFITILAQFVGVYKTLSGQSKPFWEKAESTR